MARRFSRRRSFVLVLGAAALVLIAQGLVVPLLRSGPVAAASPPSVPPGEVKALRHLHELKNAQVAVQAPPAGIDTDVDRRGEYGFLAELAGAVPVRIYDAVTDAPALGVDPDDILHPAYLPSRYGEVVPNAHQEGVVRLGAYVFQVFLPEVTAAAKTPAVAEDPLGGTLSFPDSDNVELLWCAYAWPMVVGPDSRRAFFVNQEGVILATLNRDAGYAGLTQTPPYDAAYSDETGGQDMGAPLGITAVIAPLGHAANDGRVWTVVP